MGWRRAASVRACALGMGGLPSIAVVEERSIPCVKVCCIANVQEAWMAIDAGASALGLVTEMPSGPGVISDAAAAAIAAVVPPGVDTFLLTSRQNAAGILEQHHSIGTSTIQLVDRVEPSELAHLRRALPGIRLVQVVHVQGEDSVETAL